MRFLMLSSLHENRDENNDNGQQPQMVTIMLTRSGQVMFPTYEIQRERSIFHNRSHLIR